MLYTVNCAILGIKDTFTIEIDSDEPVYHLKKQIKEEKFRTLASFRASELQLYKVNIPVSDFRTLLESVFQNTVKYKEDQKLQKSWSKLSAYFGMTGPLVRETLHILVERPRSESFGSSWL